MVGHEKSVIQCAADRCLAAHIPFFRLCPVGIDVRIDQVDDDKLMQMIWDSMLHLYLNCEVIDELGETFAKLLLNTESTASSPNGGTNTERSEESPTIFRQRRQTTS